MLGMKTYPRASAELLVGIGVQLLVLAARKLVSSLPPFIATYGSLIRYAGAL
jgi:hypothetical protein